MFPWRCCGTIYLKEPITKNESEKLIEKVINKLSNTFHAKNLTFGQKILYMDIISTISNCDERIQYFDAGIGSKKLIEWDKDIRESYFNDISLMHYIQTYEENNKDVTSDYYKLLVVDSSCILDNDN